MALACNKTTRILTRSQRISCNAATTLATCHLFSPTLGESVSWAIRQRNDGERNNIGNRIIVA